jgi:transposase-like protein
MAEKVFRQDQIIAKMREAEALFKEGLTIAEVSRRLVISEQTCCRWRKQFAGMWFRPGS